MFHSSSGEFSISDEEAARQVHEAHDYHLRAGYLSMTSGWQALGTEVGRARYRIITINAAHEAKTRSYGHRLAV